MMFSAPLSRVYKETEIQGRQTAIPDNVHETLTILY